MKYSGKYAIMAEQLRADGCDERAVEWFVREEMEADEWRAGEGVTEVDAWRQWRSLPAEERRILLTSAFCLNCGMTRFAPGYSVRRSRGDSWWRGRAPRVGRGSPARARRSELGRLAWLRGATKLLDPRT